MSDSVIIYRETLQPFFAACGGRAGLSLAIARRSDRDSVNVQSFDKPFVRIGRSVGNDLALADEGVSFRHLYLQVVDGNWAYFNLHSTMRAKGRRQAPNWGWLDEARELNIGPYVVTTQPDVAAPGEPCPATACGELAPSVAEFELELVNRQNLPGRRITRPVTLIGSARHCDLWLKDPSVSSVHASLVLTPRGLWIVDLLGRNGVTVDRRRVSWKQLKNGSFLEIGRFCFRVWINNAAPLTPEASDLSRDFESVAATSPLADRGDLTRDFVMGVLQHLVESRYEFFEHLRHQSQMISQLTTQLNDVRAAPLAQELQRIEALDRELAEIKTQLSQLAATHAASPKAPDAEFLPEDPVETASSPAVDEQALAVDVSSHRSESDPLPDSAALSESNSVVPVRRTPPPREPENASGSIHDVHALLSQRMSRLAHERKSRWRGMLRRLGLAKSESD
jgi:pSer/pThr/pTyr-binding forkhead associated (FHA) protein/polyhydroxyalkanoate synthesis regulator phasin